jgi:hypothetical protein
MSGCNAMNICRYHISLEAVRQMEQGQLNVGHVALALCWGKTTRRPDGAIQHKLAGLQITVSDNQIIAVEYNTNIRYQETE